MIFVKVESKFIRKNKAVYLKKTLPTGHGFGNVGVVKSGTKGYFLSDDFVNGQLSVEFPLHQGTERVKFNSLSAGEFLECDPYF